MSHASTGTRHSDGAEVCPGSNCSPHAPNRTAASTATIPGQLARPAARQVGMTSTGRVTPVSRGSRNWSTHITTVVLGKAIADHPATLKKPFSTWGNHQVSTAATPAVIRHVYQRRQLGTWPTTFWPALTIS